MTIRTTIRMDLKTKSMSGTLSRVNAVQADKYSRDLSFLLYDGSLAWAIPEGASAIVRYCRADGSGGSYDLMPDGSKACEILGNTVTARLAPAVLSVPGPVRLAVGLIVGETEINTFTVIVDVEANPGLVPTAEGYYKVLGSLPETAISYGTADLTAGTSPLATGSLYLVYE